LNHGTYSECSNPSTILMDWTREVSSFLGCSDTVGCHLVSAFQVYVIPPSFASRRRLRIFRVIALSTSPPPLLGDPPPPPSDPLFCPLPRPHDPNTPPLHTPRPPPLRIPPPPLLTVVYPDLFFAPFFSFFFTPPLRHPHTPLSHPCLVLRIEFSKVGEIHHLSFWEGVRSRVPGSTFDFKVGLGRDQCGQASPRAPSLWYPCLSSGFCV